MTKIKMLMVSSLVVGGALFGNGCIQGDRWFNAWDWAITTGATVFAAPFVNQIIATLTT